MINKLLYSLSSTDQELITGCDARSKTQQQAKGAMVFFTGFLAIISAIYALSLLTRSIFLIIFFGIAYSSIVVFLHRYIISAATKRVALLGLLFAIIFGILTSVTIELKLFERSIDEEISKRQMETLNLQIDEQEMRIRELEDEIKQSRKKLEKLQEELINEASGKSGSRFPGKGAIYQQKLEIYEDFKSQTEQKIARLTIEIENNRHRSKVLMSADSENRSEDFLSRLETLQEIQKSSPAVLQMIWLLRSMFILTYAMPFLVIFLGADTEYSLLVRKRQADMLRYEPEYRVARIANSRISIPDFGHGFATAMDWTGMLAPGVEELRGGDKTPDAADAASLAGDWEAVGNDLEKVLNKHGAKAT